MTCDCRCGGEPRGTNIEIGIKHVLPDGTTTTTKTGTHKIGAVYAEPGDRDMTWVARHPGGQWVPLEPLDEEAGLHQAADGEVTG